MKFKAVAAGLILIASGLARATEEPRIVEKVTPLPVALSKDFQFRKTKLFFLGEKAPQQALAGQTSNTVKPGALTGGGGGSTAPSQKTVTLQDARQRFGDYFDFFWRAKRPADLTVRLEYRQEKLHEHVQAQEISYRNVRGTHKTEFNVIGD